MLITINILFHFPQVQICYAFSFKKPIKLLDYVY